MNVISRNYFLSAFVLVEIVTLAVYIFCILTNIINGTRFTTKDKVFTSLVLGICISILAITVLVCARARNNGERDSENQRHIETANKEKILNKFRPIHKTFGSDCAICLSPKEVESDSLVQLACQHDYHLECISECFQKTEDFRCPKCRQISRDFPITAKVGIVIRSCFKSPRLDKKLAGSTGTEELL